MKTSLPLRHSDSQTARSRALTSGFLSPFNLRQPSLSLALFACLALTSCSFLKPARTAERRFVLTPLLPAAAATIPSGAPALGVGPVKLPGYLFNTSLAVCRGTNEIEYLPLTLWAERLDTSLQRVLAGNLAALLPTDKVRLSSWRSEDVGAEVYVAIEQFDVDARGQATLMAWWRILAPGGEQTLKSGQAQLTRQGPSPDTDPAGAVTTLSQLVADFSRQLTQALQETIPRQTAPAPK